MRTAKKDNVFYEVIQAQDLDGSALSGLAASDFSVLLLKNGSSPSSAPTETITEIGVTGNYSFSITFDATGFWTAIIEVSYLSEVIEYHTLSIEVLARNIDDVYSVVAGSGSGGTETAELTVLNSSNSTPIPDTRIDVFGSDGTTFITFGTTDSIGEVEISLSPGTYIAKGYIPGYSVPATTLTIIDTGGQTIQETTISATGVVVVPPSSATLCRLYADVVDLNGVVLPDFEITITNLFDASSSLSVMERTTSKKTDSDGHVEIDIVRGLKIQVAFVSTGLTRIITVPDQETANLSTLVGDVSDPFSIVEADIDPFVAVSMG